MELDNFKNIRLLTYKEALLKRAFFYRILQNKNKRI